MWDLLTINEYTTRQSKGILFFGFCLPFYTHTHNTHNTHTLFFKTKQQNVKDSDNMKALEFHTGIITECKNKTQSVIWADTEFSFQVLFLFLFVFLFVFF